MVIQKLILFSNYVSFCREGVYIIDCDVQDKTRWEQDLAALVCRTRQSCSLIGLRYLTNYYQDLTRQMS